MTYYELTTNTNASLDAIAFIETGLSAHAGWSFIESTTFSTKTARVWKCLGSQNAGGQDFHVIIIRDTTPISTSFISMRVAEGYNSTTHSVIRPIPPNASGVPVSQADYSIGNGVEYPLTQSGTGAQLDSTSLNGGGSLTAQIDHFLVVSKSFIAYSANANGVSTAGFYAGNFNSVYSPIYNSVMLVGVINGTGNASRFPNYTVTPTGADVVILPATYPSGYMTTATTPDVFRGVLEASGVIISGITPTLPIANMITNIGNHCAGGSRGTLPTSVMLMVNEAGAARNGDHFSVGGTDYFRVGYNGSATYSSKAASANKSFWISKSATY